MCSTVLQFPKSAFASVVCNSGVISPEGTSFSWRCTRQQHDWRPDLRQSNSLPHFSIYILDPVCLPSCQSKSPSLGTVRKVSTSLFCWHLIVRICCFHSVGCLFSHNLSSSVMNIFLSVLGRVLYSRLLLMLWNWSLKVLQWQLSLIHISEPTRRA